MSDAADQRLADAFARKADAATILGLLDEGADLAPHLGRFRDNAVLASAPLVRRFIEAGADPTKGMGHLSPPLTYVAGKGACEVARVLVEAIRERAPLNRFTLWSPLKEAIDKGHHEMTRLLAEAVVEPGAAPPQEVILASPHLVEAMTAASYSPLCGAAWRGWLDVIDLLLDRGLSADDTSELVVREGEDGFDLVHYRAAPALVLAAAYGRAPVVRRLLRAGADPSAMDGDGRTALMLARARGHDEVVPLLGDPDAPAPVSLPGLLDASDRGDRSEVERAIEGGIDVSAIADSGEHRGSTALARAAGSGHREVVERLLAAGADPGQPEHCPPLLEAVRGGHGAVVARLLEAGADLEARDRDGQNALLAAWEPEGTSIAAMLLEAGADPNAATDDGQTALFSAVTFQDLPRIELLLAHGADPRVKDRHGTTLLQHARSMVELDPAVLERLKRAIAEAKATGRPVHETVPYRAELRSLQAEVDAVDLSDYQWAAVRPRLEARRAESGFAAVVDRVASEPGAQRADAPLGDVPGARFEFPPATDLPSLLERYADADALVLMFGRRGGALTVLPTTDPLEVIAAAGVAGPNYDVSAEDFMRWAIHVYRAHPFRVTQVGHDRVQGTFCSELPEPALMAERIYAICPDAVDQGYESLTALTQGLRRRELSLWWD